MPVLVMLIFKCFLVQVGDFISYGVCKFVFLGSTLGHPKGVPCAELSPQVTEGFPATAANRFHKELRFFFSLLKRKKEAKKEKSSRFTCTVRQMHHPKIIQRIFRLCKIFYIYVETPPPPNGGPPPLSGEAFLPCEFPSTKLPRRGIQAAAAAVTLPLLQLKSGRRVSGDSPPAVTLPFLQLKLGRKVSGDPPRA